MYGIITHIRNILFDFDILRTKSHEIKTISVGNLRVGGTGKTPFVEYLVKRLSQSHKIAVVSRGYGRKTKGYIEANPSSTAAQIGDEPLQIANKFKEILVAVCENRNLAIETIRKNHPEINLILLDDAFQHRYVRRDLNILLTEYNRPFFKDCVMPFGRLREYAFNYKRADYIVVTKCPPLTAKQKGDFVTRLKPYDNQKVFFSNIIYKEPYLITDRTKTTNIENKSVVLLTAIANNSHIVKYLDGISRVEGVISFKDHHGFTERDIKRIKERFCRLKTKDSILLTTEKDATKLRAFPLPLHVLPIDIEVSLYPNQECLIEKTIEQDVRDDK